MNNKKAGIILTWKPYANSFKENDIYKYKSGARD